MSKSAKKRTVGLLVILAAAAGVMTWYNQRGDVQTVENEKNYKEEKVKYGSVATGITESGSVSFGTLEQVFEIAEVTVTSSSSDSSSGDSSSLGSQSGSADQNMAGGQSMAGSQSVAGGQSMAMGVQSSMGGATMGGFDMVSAESTSSDSSSSSSGSSSDALTVEEVYVAVGQVVSQGDAILKINEESIANYRTALESAVAKAELAVTQEEINVESKRAEADYTYNMYLAEGETAQETYEATITSLENDVTDLEEELAEALEEVEEYQDYVDSGYDYDEELEEAELNYSTVEANLQIAKNNLTTQSIEAKQTYENAMTNYKYAEQLYEIDTNGLEDDLNDAKEVLEEAEEALAEFEEQIGDGKVYAEYSGTIMTVSFAQEDELTDEMSLLTYADSDDVTIAVSVSQEDISQISVGDSARISLTAYDGETFDGEVTGIDTSSVTGSSTVNYSVTVRFTGDTGKVYSGMTGEVTFVTKAAEDVLYISNKAVHQEGTRIWANVLQEDGSIQEVEIETGFSNGSVVEAVSGLEEGQTVLLESQVNG